MGIKRMGAGKTPINVIKSTAPLSASGIAVTGSCVFCGILVQTDGTNDVTINIYDDLAGSAGRLIPEDTIIDGSARLWALSLSQGIGCDNGIYVSISGTGGVFQVHYDEG